MLVSARPVVVWCAAVVVAAGCSHAVGGRAPRAAPGIDDESQSPVDVETLMLDQSQMRAITGAGDHLTIIPSMDGKVRVDIDQLAKPLRRNVSGSSKRPTPSAPTLRSFTRRHSRIRLAAA